MSNQNTPLAVALLSGAAVGVITLVANLGAGVAVISGAVVTSVALLLQSSQPSVEKGEKKSKDRKEKKG